MRIGIAALGNPESVATWSGIPYNILWNLRKRGHNVLPITLSIPTEPWYYNWLRRIHYRLQKKWFLSEVEELYLRQLGKKLDEEVARLDVEVVLVIHGDFLAYTSFPQPAIIIHDTTFATLVDYYDSFTNLTKRSIKAGNKMYQNALNRANASVFCSTWASKSAIKDYGIPSSKIFTIPFGANLTEIPEILEVKECIAERSLSKQCNFLYLGADWVRKGGPDALKVVVEMNRQGIKSFLTIVGCSPVVPREYQSIVKIEGFLQKDLIKDAEKLDLIFKQSNVLILPSIAECFGCVYCEANAYGLPVLGRDTGGVSEIITDGVNGLLLKKEELPEAFAERWIAIWQNKSVYKQMSADARDQYDKRLNYEVFVKELEKVLCHVSGKVLKLGTKK